MKGIQKDAMPAFLYRFFLSVNLIGLLLLVSWTLSQAHTPPEKVQAQIAEMQKLAPGRGYLDAHKDVEKPLGLLGGPITVTIRQESGGVFVALPDNRRLDPNVFGVPGLPRAYGGTPGINGVPPVLRVTQGKAYTVMKKKSPFGDKYIVLAEGKLQLKAVDATATDAAQSHDSVQMEASWKDKAGNTYAVKCCKKLAVHGVEYPTFGGVVTNHIMHGWSRIGTALMPTMFSYFAFWGMGEVRKNGTVVDAPRLIHGMLTEYVRTTGYKLGFDRDVTPTRLHFHLMIPPFAPVPQEGKFTPKPVKTGFTLPNGKPLPFWHVMFENLEIEAERG
ncbi:MAG: hypothetical protein D6736_16745 [Nitrospinota bacterium]|nr:MAG: hypothetical protein D6736_16745 [Nitrospinota bacterium]